MPTFRILELRRQLAAEIDRSLGPMSQHVIAPSFGIPQPRMSELSRGVVDRCSVEWLIRCIHRLGGSVEITVHLGDAGRQWRVERAARMHRESTRR
jgi:predicted XRE-type DNA-binding protein